MIRDIVIIGAGGWAKEITFLIQDINMEEKTWNLLGYLEKNNDNVGDIICDYEIIGNDDSFFNSYSKDLDVVIAIGNSNKIKSLSDRLLQSYSNLIFPNLIHPSVSRYMRGVSLGQGNIICAGNILTTDIDIGNFNYINRGCNISHDINIGNY